MQLDVMTDYGRFQVSLPRPQGEMRWPELVYNLFPLEGKLVALGVAAAEKEGRRVSCRAGCGACCRQPVPISAPEAFLLWEMLAGLPAERREACLDGFAVAREQLRAAGFGERSLEGESAVGLEVVELALDYFRLQIPCPFLVQESCSIHPFRPMSCREHLVTSPSELCADPVHPGIRGIRAPASLTQALAQAYADVEGGTPMLLPLPVAFEFAREHKEARLKRHDAAGLLSAFLAILAPMLAAEPNDE